MPPAIPPSSSPPAPSRTVGGPCAALTVRDLIAALSVIANRHPDWPVCVGDVDNPLVGVTSVETVEGGLLTPCVVIR